MKKKILEELKKLEIERDIKILFASESGSRAWGFPSPDSDYDVRFFYKKPLDWYLTLGEQKDNIDLGVNELLDINGWDIRKTLRLLKKSNASPLEWINSPIIYYEQPEFRKEVKNLLSDCFSPISTIHHYLSMAKRFYENCNGDQPAKLKSWFYGLRSSLNALWILENKTLPPILFTETLILLNHRPNIVQKIENLIELKAQKNESFLFEKDTELLNLMKSCIDRSDLEFKTLPGNKVKQLDLDTLFRKIIKNEY